MSAWDDGFEAPVGPPQFDQLENSSIQELMLEAPIFDQGMAAELLQICRTHMSVRSAIMYAMQVATAADMNLKTLNEPTEIFRAQGEFRGLNRYVTNIIESLKAAETPEKEEDNALE